MAGWRRHICMAQSAGLRRHKVIRTAESFCFQKNKNFFWPSLFIFDRVCVVLLKLFYKIETRAGESGVASFIWDNKQI